MLHNARSDLYIAAWVDAAEAKAWQALRWWWEFDAVLAPATNAARLKTALKRPVAGCPANDVLGAILRPENFMRIRINADAATQARASTLYKQLKQAGVSCWMAEAESRRPRIANVSVMLTGKGKSRHSRSAIKSGTLVITVPPAAELPSAAWLQQILEQKLGRSVHTS
jgi:hypothetical protein